MFKKTLAFLLVLISVLILAIRFGETGIKSILGLEQKSGINVLSSPQDATVFINDEEMGKTPYENKDLKVGEYTIKLEKDGMSWQGKVKLNQGTATVVSRELSKDMASSAGEILILSKGRGVTIVSNPGDSEITIDGKSYGKTPLSFNLDPGEYNFNISHSNYSNRSIMAQFQDGYNLTISVDLALSEADLTTINTPVITTTQEVVIKDTPVGFLRVRDKASTAGKEIAQVKPGDTLVLLEELPNWYRVRLPDNKEGFISSAYAQKKTEDQAPR